MAVEAAYGRERGGERNAPRTLDVDLIVVGDRRADEEDLKLPHPRAAERAFVLVPWLDLEPDAEIPGVGPVAELRREDRPRRRHACARTSSSSSAEPGSEPRERAPRRRGRGARRPQGRIRPTGPGPAGRLRGHRAGARLGGAAARLRLGTPSPTSRSPRSALLFFVAAIVGGVGVPHPAHRTPRPASPRPPPGREPAGARQGLRRWSGRLALGGYLGYALAQLGVGDPAADTRLWRSLLAGLGAARRDGGGPAAGARVSRPARPTT